MFDKSVSNSGGNWVWNVKEEILRRCANAAILHIAVDTESNEGCVYIKTRDTDEASKVANKL